MTYLEGIGKLKDIENSYNVMSITFKGVPIWPFVRIYLFQILGHTNQVEAHKVESAKIKTILKALFAYNPFTLFRKHKTWLYTSTERRKAINGKYIQRVSGFISEVDKNCLVIEKPCPNIPHPCKKDILEKSVISEAYQLFAAHIIERFLRYRKIKIENEDIILNILSDLGISFDYKYYVRYLWSQKIVTDILLGCSGKPRRVLIECPYTILGYLWSFHVHNIKVVELQHGVIGTSHYAYILNHSSILSPDEIWVYGQRDVDFLKKYNPNYASRIYDTGLYYLDYAYRAFNSDVFEKYRHRYKFIVVFAGQAAVESASQQFLDDVSKYNPDLLFVYVPRYSDEIFKIERPNVIFAPGVNIYQYLKWCDFHSTVSSTTCLEAAYYGKKTIFYNYENLAYSYYGESLKEGEGVRYINNAPQFRKALEHLTCETIQSNCFSNFSIDFIAKLLNR